MLIDNQNQMTLLPETIPDTEDIEVLLSELPENSTLLGPDPDKKMVNSMNRFGQIDRIILVKTPDGYDVANGTGRVKVARILGWETIKAKVYPEGTILSAVLALTTNQQRRSNPIRDLEKILHLESLGATPKMIKDEIGLPDATYQKRIKLKNLIPPLLYAMGQGKILVKHGEACAKLTIPQQEKLAEVLEKDGKISETDIYEVTRAAKQEFEDFLNETAIEAEQQSMIEGNFGIATNWEDEILGHLIEMIEILPPEAEEFREAFKSIGRKMGANI